MACIDCLYEARCHAQAEDQGITYCAAQKQSSSECEPQAETYSEPK